MNNTAAPRFPAPFKRKPHRVISSQLRAIDRERERELENFFSVRAFPPSRVNN